MKIREELVDWVVKLTGPDASLNSHMTDGNINPDNLFVRVTLLPKYTDKWGNPYFPKGTVSKEIMCQELGLHALHLLAGTLLHGVPVDQSPIHVIKDGKPE